MLERKELADGVRWNDGRCVLTLRRPAPHVELLRCEGHARVEHLPRVIESRDRILRESGRIALFDDLEFLTGYDSAVRAGLTRWSKEHRGDIIAFHILVRSKIAAMGVTVANMALGGHIIAHTRRLDFEATLAQVIRAG